MTYSKDVKKCKHEGNRREWAGLTLCWTDDTKTKTVMVCSACLEEKRKNI